MLTCKQARSLIVRTIDDESLSGEARARLRAHLARCAPCREEYETQHDVRRLLALQIECKLPAGFDDRLSARLTALPPREPSVDIARGDVAHGERSIAAAAAPAAFPIATPNSWEPSTAWRRGMRWRTWGLRLLPAAAALVLIVAGTHVRDRMTPDAASLPASSEDTSVGTESTARPRVDARTRRPDPQRPDPRRLDLQRHDPQRPLADLLARSPAAQTPARPAAGIDAGSDRDATFDATAVRANSETVNAATSPTTASTRGTPLTTLPSVPFDPIALSVSAPRLTPDLAEDLKLSDAQRKQIEAIYDQRQQALDAILARTRKRVELERYEIDAAIERVLTPEQRRQYRERQASQGSTVLTTPAGSLPPTRSPIAPRSTAPPELSSPPF